MEKEHEMGEDLQANLGVVIKGDIYEVRDLLTMIQDAVKKNGRMQLVYTNVRTEKMWIVLGEGVTNCIHCGRHVPPGDVRCGLCTDQFIENRAEKLIREREARHD